MEIQPFALTPDGTLVNMALVRSVFVVKTSGAPRGQAHFVHKVQALFDDDTVVTMVTASNEDEAQKCLDHIFINGGVVNYRDNHPAAAWGKQPKRQ